MKHFLLSALIYILPLIYINTIEPIESCNNVYSEIDSVYMYCFLSLLYISWGYTSNQIAKWFLNK